MRMSASEKMMQHWVLDSPQIKLYSAPWYIINMVTEKAEFPSPGLIDMVHTCL